jgi:hypothetical protein
VREAAFDDPALSSEPGAVLGAAPSDQRLDPASPQQPTVLVVVIATIGDHDIGFLPRPPSLTGDGSAVQVVQQRQQLGDVVALAAGQRNGERDARRVDEQVVL